MTATLTAGIVVAVFFIALIVYLIVTTPRRNP